jgi:hypothetical protein
MRMALALTFAFSMTSIGQADHHHKEWWDFLLGSWSYENQLGADISKTGTLTFKMAPSGEAMTGEWREDGGSSAYEVAGWKADKKVLQVNGYGTESSYWQIDVTEFGDSLKGSHHGQLPDGTSYKGEIALTKTGDHSWTWEFTGETADGEKLEMSGKMERSAADRRRRSLQATPTK